MDASSASSPQGGRRWLLLLHQLPPEPAYVRVKVSRRLKRLGAVPLKNSVYVLPETDEHLEDFQWLANEIMADGGDATICSAAILSGVSDAELESQFQDAAPPRADQPQDAPQIRNAVWVTRSGVFVDRIASAWLIKRFIDPQARFKFAPARGYKRLTGEQRFDMYDGEFTHVGDYCTFETLLRRFRLKDAALRRLAEIVHDIDCKDEKFGRAETAGVAAVLQGLAQSTADDTERLSRGALVFDGLYGQV